MSVVGHVQHRTDGLLRLGQGTGLKLDLCSRALCQTGSQKASPAGAAVGCLPHECDLEVSGLFFFVVVWFDLVEKDIDTPGPASFPSQCPSS